MFPVGGLTAGYPNPKVTLLMILAVDSVYFAYSVDFFSLTHTHTHTHTHIHIHICTVSPLIV